jgi:AraC-like DNA-binding protein
MHYEERRLAPPLDRWVECVWQARADAAGPAQTIVPDGCPELIFQLGDPFWQRTDGVDRLQPRALLVGPTSGPLQLQAAGRVHTIGVRFRPGGMARFVRAPLAAFADRALQLDDVFGNAGRDLVQTVAEARRPEATIAAFLQRRLREQQPRDPLPAATRQLIDSRGSLTVDALADACGLGPRQLERRFLDGVGLSPKRFGRIVRLQEVLRRAGTRPWVDVAIDCGYADQSHLTRDFRALTGNSPDHWLRHSAGELAQQFVSPARLDAFFAG